MRDEGFTLAHGVLNVARAADLDEVEGTFARLYKAARRLPSGGDHRRQELNAALEVMSDPDKRAATEVEAYWVPLAADREVPSAEALAADLLPLRLALPASAAEHVLLPPPQAVVDEVLSRVEAPEVPDERTILRQLAARAAWEHLDPWA
ncbi:MAG: hypothetical protein HZB16_00590 [Armatimonadetes bacterium]|nr:hypothetical protein [Armatimonadota bacterium]